MKTLTILGSTSSVGQQTLDVLRLHRNDFQLISLTARSASLRFVEQCLEFEPLYAAVERDSTNELQRLLAERKSGCKVIATEDTLTDSTIFDVNVTLTGIPGSSGLKPTLQAVRYSDSVLIVNKEPVVMLGDLLKQEVQVNSPVILPVDSEHNAIFQCAESNGRGDCEPFTPIPGLRRILLTGSGGPFLNAPISELSDVTPEQALAHPVWSMGAKISIDSATMMNKGLEIIEARWLFDTPINQIDVVIHPQGIIHSMVEYEDGSIIAQMASPDMRVPIANALFWPERKSSGAEFVDISKIHNMSFQPPDYRRFPCLQLAREVAASDTTSAAVMNAANEVAVDAFLSGQLKFTDIYSVIRKTVDALVGERVESIEHILEIDKMARMSAREHLSQLKSAD